MPRSKTDPYKPSIQEIFYRERLKELLIKKESRPIKKKKYGRSKIECKAYKNMFIVAAWLDKKFKHWKQLTNNTLSYRKILKRDLFMGSNFQGQINQLRGIHTIINNTTTTSIPLKSTPLGVILEENPIVTEINNIIVNPSNEPAPKQELNTYGPVCDISNITCYSSGILLR